MGSARPPPARRGCAFGSFRWRPRELRCAPIADLVRAASSRISSARGDRVTLALSILLLVGGTPLAGLADESAIFDSQRFAIRRRIGAGAMGVVYEAFDRELGSRI